MVINHLLTGMIRQVVAFPSTFAISSGPAYSAHGTGAALFVKLTSSLWMLSGHPTMSFWKALGQCLECNTCV